MQRTFVKEYVYNVFEEQKDGNMKRVSQLVSDTKLTTMKSKAKALKDAGLADTLVLTDAWVNSETYEVEDKLADEFFKTKGKVIATNEV